MVFEVIETLTLTHGRSTHMRAHTNMSTISIGEDKFFLQPPT